MILPIVEPKELEACPEWGLLAPGSVAVLIKREVGHFLYYEGGIYQRGDREPTREERRHYAVHAAGRAAQDYSTVARLFITDPDAYKHIGSVDCVNWQVTFNALEEENCTCWGTNANGHTDADCPQFGR